MVPSILMAVPMTNFQGTASGVFTNPSGGVTTGVGTDFFTWGDPITSVSSLRFTGKSFSVNTRTGLYVLGSFAQKSRPKFSIGTLDYHNGTVEGGTEADSVQLETTIQLTSPVQTGPVVIPIQLDLVNTENNDDPTASADSVYLPGTLAPVTLTTTGGAPITIEANGFGNVTANGFTQVKQFFVLEESSATADLYAQIASPCEAIVRNAVEPYVIDKGMYATFRPNFDLTLTEAADLCGYDHFNWYQVITHISTTHPFRAKNDPDTSPVAPFIDPALGGWTYESGNDLLPFYWAEGGAAPEEKLLSTYTSSTSLLFMDTPSWPGLPYEDFIGFTTMLVGVLADNSWDALYSWNWKTTFTGTTGDTGRLNNIIPFDPDSGTGGVTILKKDLTASDIPKIVRDLMEKDGARNLEVKSSISVPINLLLRGAR